MNQENILFTEQTLLETATSLRGNVAKLRDLLEDATRNIDKTSPIWTGPAAESLRAKFGTLKTKFEPFCQFVDNTAQFLDDSAMQQAASERKIEKAAEDLIN